MSADTATQVTIWHNPACSTSRRALELIRAAGVEPRVVLYLKDAPDRAALAGLAARVEGGAGALLRRKGDLWEELAPALGLDRPDVTDAAILDAIAAHPALLNRPVVAGPGGAAACRPPERALDLLSA